MTDYVYSTFTASGEHHQARCTCDWRGGTYRDRSDAETHGALHAVIAHAKV